MDLKGRDFLTLKDFTPEEIAYLLDLSAELKEKKKKGIPVDTLRGKNVALIFEKTSTRTRCSFEVAAHDLGMGTTYLDPTGSQIGKKESIKDTARVLAGMYEGIEYRGFGQEIVEELAKYSKVPVWNGLTNEYHPTQMLADMLTIQEEFGHLKGIKFVYMGDARYNMGNSLMIASAKMGMDFVACAPKKYFPNAELVAQCEEYAKESGATITLTEEEDTVIQLQGFQQLLFFFLILLNPKRAADLVVHRICVYGLCLKLQTSVAVEPHGKNTADFHRKHNTHDMKLILHRLWQGCKILVKIIFLFVCTCSAKHYFFII